VRVGGIAVAEQGVCLLALSGCLLALSELTLALSGFAMDPLLDCSEILVQVELVQKLMQKLE